VSDKPKLAKRRPIRKAELLLICERQGIMFCQNMNVKDILSSIKIYGKCEYSGEKINGQEIDFDHRIPIAMQYEGDPVEWQVILRKWHKVKTKKDVADVAKAKRMSGEKGQYARRQRRKESGKPPQLRGRKEIQSRGFQKPPDGHSPWGKRGKSRGNTRHDD